MTLYIIITDKEHLLSGSCSILNVILNVLEGAQCQEYTKWRTNKIADGSWIRPCHVLIFTKRKYENAKAKTRKHEMKIRFLLSRFHFVKIKRRKIAREKLSHPYIYDHILGNKRATYIHICAIFNRNTFFSKIMQKF